jgi:DNA-binding transcriptional LysR family regulator
MELRHIRYFVAVAEELHFGRAADRLHISQPPLSQQIQNLERELGVELLKRTKHSVQMTEAGRVFLEEARHVLGDAAHAMEAAKRAGRTDSGRLSVGFGPSPEGGLLKRVLAVFLGRYSDVHLELHSLYTQEQVDALTRREIQVAFPLLPIPHRGLIVEPITIEPLVVALPSGHPLAELDPLPLARLKEESFIFFTRAVAPSYYDLVIAACRKAGFAPRVTHEESHVYPVLALVAARLGVAVLPEPASTSRKEGVVYRAIAPPTPTVEMGLAYRRDDPSKILASFRDVVREVVRDEWSARPFAPGIRDCGPFEPLRRPETTGPKRRSA